jgi:hypothetical protein
MVLSPVLLVLVLARRTPEFQPAIIVGWLNPIRPRPWCLILIVTIRCIKCPHMLPDLTHGEMMKQSTSSARLKRSSVVN